MTRSMTAFSRKQSQGDWGQAVWEIRSVNHRFLDLVFRIPDSMRELEPKLRELTNKYVGRGRVECFLKFHESEQVQTKITIKQSLLTALQTAAGNIAENVPNTAALNPMELLRWPGMVDIEKGNLEVANQQVLQLFEAALENLVTVREQEGKALQTIVGQRLENILIEIKNIAEKIPAILQARREKLKESVAELQVELDPERLEQEMLLLVNKSDVAEELDRINAHVVEIQKIFKQEDPIGRRLDFLIQELHREANTLGSKSIDLASTQASVELKVLIEQMREQVQNIE